MKKINLNYLEDVSEKNWEKGTTEILLKYCDEPAKEIGEVLVDDETIIYNLKNVEDDMYLIKRCLRQILKNEKIERNSEKVYIDGKLFGERKEDETFVYCETENEIEFLNFVKTFDDISLNFFNSSKSFNVKFSFSEIIPIYVKLVDKFLMEKIIKEETIETENGIRQVYTKEQIVEVNDIVAATSVLKWISNYNYDKVQSLAQLIRKSIIKKLPKNNLTDNCKGIWSSFEGFEDDVQLTPEMVYVLSNFYYSPVMSFDEALKTISEASENKRIGSFEIVTEKGKLASNPFKNEKLVLKSENGTKMNVAIEDFYKISEYVKEFELEYNKKVKRVYYSGTEININIDFKYLRELSEKTGKGIKFGIINSYANFKIDGGTLEIEFSPYYDKEEIEEYKKKFSEAFQYFENVETYSN